MAFIKKLLLFLRQILVLPIRFYQKFISPVIHARQSSCRYHPSCSQYTKDAILNLGFIPGFILGLARILRCHGLFSGGYDPVPERFTFRAIGESYRKFWGKGKESKVESGVLSKSKGQKSKEHHTHDEEGQNLIHSGEDSGVDTQCKRPSKGTEKSK